MAVFVSALFRLLAEEGMASLPDVQPTLVTTPCGPCHGLSEPDRSNVVVVSIVRSGDTLLEVGGASSAHFLSDYEPLAINRRCAR